MMKKLLIGVLALAAYGANAKMESAKSYKFAGDTGYANFCKAVVTDDLELLKLSIRSKVGVVASTHKDVLRKLISVDGMKCNGIDLVEFSKQREAQEVNAYFTQAL